MSSGLPLATGRVVEILGTSTGGVGVHVRSLVGHLTEQGWPVTVAAPASTHAVFDYAAVGAEVTTVPIHGPGREVLAVPAVRRSTRNAATSSMPMDCAPVRRRSSPASRRAARHHSVPRRWW